MKPEPNNQWLHPLHCDCETCEPYRPSVPERLTMAHLGILTATGVVVGNAIAFLYDPHAALAALAATIGIIL